MWRLPGDMWRCLVCAAVLSVVLLPVCSWGAEEDFVTVKSEILFDGAETFVPPEHYMDGRGIVYDLKNWTMVPVKTATKEKKIRQTVIFEKVEKKEEIPEEYEIMAEDSVRKKNYEQDYPILELSVKKERWQEDFSFPLVFHSYDADYYELGEKKIPYDAERPQLEGDEEELLRLIGENTENYRIHDVRWDGDPYLDDVGILCRKALVYGSRRTVDYAVVYGGTAVFPEVEGQYCEMVYAIPKPERESAVDVQVLSVEVSEPKPEDEAPENGWLVIRRGILVTVTLVFVVLILVLTMLLIRRWKENRGKKHEEPDWDEMWPGKE